jgi:hypothetical protein
MGCHKADGSGQGKFVPAVTGKMAQFLALPLGRDYLARVPGSAQSMLNDRELADLLNWMLHEFDASHIPAGFEPYTADEVGMLRRSPLSNPSRTRQRLANELDAAAAAQHYLDK